MVNLTMAVVMFVITFASKVPLRSVIIICFPIVWESSRQAARWKNRRASNRPHAAFADGAGQYRVQRGGNERPQSVCRHCRRRHRLFTATVSAIGTRKKVSTYNYSYIIFCTSHWPWSFFSFASCRVYFSSELRPRRTFLATAAARCDRVVDSVTYREYLSS